MARTLLIVGVLALLVTSATAALAVRTSMEAVDLPPDGKYAINGVEMGGTTNRFVLITEVPANVARLVLDVGIGNEILNGTSNQLEEIAADEIVNVSLQVPGGHNVRPWQVEAGECHYAKPTCNRENPDFLWGHEWVVLTDPVPGTYQMIVEPGPGRERLPEWGHLRYAAFLFFDDGDYNHGALRGNDIWWYSPEGSATLVEHGHYVDDEQVIAHWKRAGIAALCFGLPGLCLLLAALVVRRRKA